MNLSDEWQNASIYFILIDRFYNGDRSNDDFGHGEYDPQDDNCFQGGDLAGIIEKLPYIRNMGFDAIWITPPVYNQWINTGSAVKGYHGYWAHDFCQVDPHFGDLETYKQLVKIAHQLGLKVVQDIVINHTGNYFSIAADLFAKGEIRKAWSAVKQAPGLPTRPNDPLFCNNHPDDLATPVYNFTPEITNFNDRQQTLNYSLADLDDLNLNNPTVVERFIEIYRYWIDEVGVDAFRVDTVYYTPPECYELFLYGKEGIEGIKTYVEKKLGRNFFVFGEIWVFDYQQQNSYLTNGQQQRLDSAIDIPLNEILGQVFYEQCATEKLAKNLLMLRVNRSLWINFIDNHDTERSFNRASWPAIAQSLVFLYSIPGIPVIYYGSEVGIKQTRANMFAEHNFNGTSKYYALIKKLQMLRKNHPSLSAGELEIVLSEKKEGVFVYQNHGAKGSYVIAFNTSLTAKKLPINTLQLQAILTSEATENFLPTNENCLNLPIKSYAIFYRSTSTKADFVFPTYPWDQFEYQEFTNVITLLDWVETTEVQFLGDRNFTINAQKFKNGSYQIHFFAQKEGIRYQVQGPEWKIDHPFLPLKTIFWQAKQPKIRLPTHPSYQGQLDIQKVELSACQKNLQLTLQMANITNGWNPPNGIDHVYFSCYLDLPNVKGSGGDFAQINMHVPDFDYNYYFLFYGWGSAIYQSVQGTEQIMDIKIGHQVNLATRELTLVFPQEMFELVPALGGIKIHLSTWDGYLGKLHPILDHPHEYIFSAAEDNLAQLPLIYNQIQLTVEKIGENA